jgi:hypothetical protein
MIEEDIHCYHCCEQLAQELTSSAQELTRKPDNFMQYKVSRWA